MRSLVETTKDMKVPWENIELENDFKIESNYCTNATIFPHKPGRRSHRIHPMKRKTIKLIMCLYLNNTEHPSQTQEQ